MNKIKNFSIIVCTLLLSLTVIAQNTQNTSDQTQAADFVPGQVLIKLKESAKARKTSLSSQVKATTLKSYTNLGVELWEMQQANDKQATLQLVEQLNNNPDVEYAEPNYLWYADDGIEPNDPYFSQLWGLNNTGQDGGTVDADIDAPEAYCIPVSLNEVVVGVIDSGVDFTHQDLAENIWQNLGEDADGDGQVLIKSGNTWIFDPGDIDGIDNDNNGYVDDFVGWDFIFNDNNPMDGLSGHGTHVAGTIAAIRDNNIGIAGVSSNAKIAALKFLNDERRASGPTSAAIEAINYAVAMNIPITNNSWGSIFYNSALYQTIQNAEANNHLFVAAADNKGRDNDQSPSYPASYDLPNIISVAAIDRNDNLAYFSNYGATSCDIAAPGVEIFSTEPGNTYGNKNGTSMASPHVAGVAAYVLGAYPGTPYATIKQSLLNAADPIPALTGKCVSNGRLNLYNALQEMGAPPCSDTPPTSCKQDDWIALKALYESTNGDNWFDRSGWDIHVAPYNNPPDGCNLDDLYGVVLDENDRVSCIDMDGQFDCGYEFSSIGNNLIGTIPPEIENLTRLTNLSLGSNELVGNIPNELLNLSNLRELRLYFNSLSGNIPNEISNLVKLEHLSLSFNGFTGNIPSQLGNIENLTELWLSNNELNGEIPVELTNLTNLKVLYLRDNTLAGTIPSEICNLTELTELKINNNQLTGCYPACMSIFCDRLILADISSDNNFDAVWDDFCNTEAGECPTQPACIIDDWLALKALYDNTNGDNWTNRTGWDIHIAPYDNPPASCNLRDLYGVVLNENDRVSCIDMDGEVNCTWSGGDNNLGNNLSGEIPDFIELLSELTHIRMAYNNITGSIPLEIGNLENLQQLDLRYNQLTGQIPVELGELSILRGLLLGANSLSGGIPSSIGNLTNLDHLWIDLNELSGRIPGQLGNLTGLSGVSLRDNQLSGCYDPNLSNWCDLQFSLNWYISESNNFDSEWEDFCDTENGICNTANQVWPGDSDNNGTVQFGDMLYWGAAYDNTGQPRPDATNNWVEQSCPDWSATINRINGKHQDANGDGIVNNTDRDVITQNMGQTHNFTEYSEAISTLQFTLNPDLSANDGSNFAYDFYIDDAGNTVTAHGVNASIFFGGLSVASAEVDVSASALNPQEVLQQFDVESNTLHFVLTKTNGVNSTLNGPVARIVVEILEVDNGESSALYVNGGSVMQANGTLEDVAATTVNSTFFEPGINNSLIDLTSSTSHTNCEVGGKAKVYASGGTGNYSYQWSTGETTQQIVDLSPGIYTVTVYDSSGEVNYMNIEVQGNFVPIYDENGKIIPCNLAICPTAIDFEDYVPTGVHRAERAIHTNVDLESDYHVELKAGNLIRLSSGFSTRGSQIFKVRMGDCE